MPNLATMERPIRVAIVGGGPAGFFTALELLKPGSHVAVDLFEKLPAPYGLVRYGVAPDHQHTRRVTKLFEPLNRDPRFTYFGNVEVGVTITLRDLRRHYDAIVIAIGAEIDRRLGIPFEDHADCHPSLEFAAWTNGHPDCERSAWNVAHQNAVIIGHGNVALDCARMLARRPEELESTDISRTALDVLRRSQIRNIYLVGRRGPVQASFGENELAEIGTLDDCGITVHANDLAISGSSLDELHDPANDRVKLNLESFKRFSADEKVSPRRNIIFLFHRAPVRIIGEQHVEGIELEETILRGAPWKQSSHGTGRKEILACGLLIKSVGHHGALMPGLPFDATRGIIPTHHHRIEGHDGIYAVGWIKRGAKGLIGHNRRDAMETAAAILNDTPTLKPCPEPSAERVRRLIGR